MNADNIERQEEKLPFDPYTFLLGLWQRWISLAVVVIISILLGVIVAKTLGKRIYQSETIMMYKPREEFKIEIDKIQSLTTRKNLVKIISNLEETRRLLNLESTLEEIGASINVFVQRDTDLLVIRSSWNDAENAAGIANTLRDVFLENQLRISKRSSKKKIVAFEGRLKNVTGQLKKADSALQDFTTANKVVDLDKEARWYLDELISLNLLFEKAKIEKTTIELQKNNFNRLINDLKKRMAEEKTANTGMENLEDIDVRLRRLGNAIREDRGYRANTAELAQKELEFKQAQRLQKEGLISEQDFNKARAAYEKQMALTEDTEQIKAWKEEIAKIDKIVIPTKKGTTPSGRMFQEIALREFDIQLKSVALTEKVNHLEKARQSIEKRLDTLPVLQRKYVALSRDITSLEEEKAPLENMLADARRNFESNATDFTLISIAKEPVMPLKSNRKLLFVMIVCAGTLSGFGLIFFLEIIDTSIKSEAEIPLKLSLPVIGSVPAFGADDEVIPCKPDAEPKEVFRIMARHIKNQLPKKGARILIASAQHGEGKTSIATNLALSFGRMDERVLLIDSQIRPEENLKSVSDIILKSENPTKGLGEYLSFEADELKETLYPTILPGVECLPRIKEAVTPDLIASNRMRDLLDEVSSKFGITIIDSSPAYPYVDAETIARGADGIIFVIRSGQCKKSILENTISRLKASGTPILGCILNDVDNLFLNIK